MLVLGHEGLPAAGGGPKAGPLLRSNQRDPNPKDNSLIRKQTSTKGFHSTFAALLSY